MDQPATIGVLPIAVAQAAEHLCATCRAWSCAGSLICTRAKRKPLLATQRSRSCPLLPHTLRSVEPDYETPAELGVLCGFDDDLTRQITGTSSRIRGLLTQIPPALQWALGPHLDHPVVADLLTRYPSPQALRTAGRGHVKARYKKHAPRAAQRLTEAVFASTSRPPPIWPPKPELPGHPPLLSLDPR